MFQPTISIAFTTNNAITTENFFSEEYLFQIIKIEMEVRTNIIVQAITIITFDGVQSGRFIV